MLERINVLAEMLDRRYKQMKSEGVRFTAIYDKLNTELIGLTHSYYYRELNLRESHPWGFDYNLGDNGGVYDDINKGILLNYELIRPADYLLAGLDDKHENTREQYYDTRIRLLSSVAPARRHAWQDEMGMLIGLQYTSAEEDFEKYRNQDIERDARACQRGFFTGAVFEFLLNSYK